MKRTEFYPEYAESRADTFLRFLQLFFLLFSCLVLEVFSAPLQSSPC